METKNEVIKTGFKNFDELTHGFRRKDLVVIVEGGIENVDIFHLALLKRIGVDAGRHTAFVYYRPPWKTGIMHLLCLYSGIGMDKFFECKLCDKDFTIIEETIRIMKATIVFYNLNNLRMETLKHAIERVVSKYKINIIFLCIGEYKVYTDWMGVDVYNSLKEIACRYDTVILLVFYPGLFADALSEEELKQRLCRYGDIMQFSDFIITAMVDPAAYADYKKDGILERNCKIIKNRNGENGTIKFKGDFYGSSPEECCGDIAESIGS